jgi:hypothetical protein
MARDKGTSLSYLTEAGQRLRATPEDPSRPRCRGACYLNVVEITEARNVWRCVFCLRYVESRSATSPQGSLF